MRQVVRILLGVFAGLALVMSRWWAPEAAACSCATPADPIQAADASNSVFVGKVVMLDSSEKNLIATLRVSKRWKGDLDPELTVYTALSEASCGFKFEKGKDYLVYAEKKDGLLHVSQCSRTKLLAEAKEDLDALNKRVWMMGGTVEQPDDTPVSSDPTQNPSNTKPSPANGNQAAPTIPEVQEKDNTTGWMIGGAAILLVAIGAFASSKLKKR